MLKCYVTVDCAAFEPPRFEHCVLRTSLQNISDKRLAEVVWPCEATLLYNLIYVKLPPKPGR